jgi:hypothetical protein
MTDLLPPENPAIKVSVKPRAAHLSAASGTANAGIALPFLDGVRTATIP